MTTFEQKVAGMKDYISKEPMENQIRFWEDVLAHEGLAPIGENTKFEADFDLELMELHDIIEQLSIAFENRVSRLFKRWGRKDREEAQVQVTLEKEFFGLPF